jgi:hypothetical protein
MWPLLVPASGQRRKTLGPEDFPHSRWAEGAAALFECVADFIHRVVLFAELDNEVTGGRLLGLGLGAMARGDKEGRLRVAAEVMAQDVKGIERIAEVLGDVLGGPTLDQVGAQGFVLTVLGQARFEEEAAELAYVFRCAYIHSVYITYTICSVNMVFDTICSVGDIKPIHIGGLWAESF